MTSLGKQAGRLAELLVEDIELDHQALAYKPSGCGAAQNTRAAAINQARFLCANLFRSDLG
jgi:hypothetical protein